MTHRIPLFVANALLLAAFTGAAHARFDWIDQARASAAGHGARAVAARSLVAYLLPDFPFLPVAQDVAPHYRSAPDYGAARGTLAAFVVLSCIQPERQAELETALAVDLADYPENDAKALALVEGRRVGEELLRAAGATCGSASEAGAM